MKKKVNVHNNWDPLKEIWLGDVWPAHFYDDLEPEIRDAWYQVTEWTKEDLSIIETTLRKLGVNVLRPYVDGPKELYLSNWEISKGKLLRPPITPRDGSAVIGNKLFFADGPLYECYRHIIDQYDPDNFYMPNKDNNIPHMSGANIVKLGRDIIIDKFIDKFKPGKNDSTYNSLQKEKEFVFNEYEKFVKMECSMLQDNYRLHLATQGGHCDGGFMPLKPGLLISTLYFKDYEIFFPDWEKIVLTNPTYHDIGLNQSAPYWYVPGMQKTYPHFNDYIEKNCKDWIGNFRETFFEVNVVMIDEKNMLCMGTHDELFNQFEKHGITCHVVPFRCRSFWDGGLHCITLDTIRDSQLIDYYPERGSYGLKTVASVYFDYSHEKFFDEYNRWRENQNN